MHSLRGALSWNRIPLAAWVGLGLALATFYAIAIVLLLNA